MDHGDIEPTVFAGLGKPATKGRTMNAIVFEHVPVAELPAEWRAKLAKVPGATVTVRIEAEDQASAKASADDPLFGMWRDREDMVDVAGYVRGIRADRFSDNPSGKD